VLDLETDGAASGTLSIQHVHEGFKEGVQYLRFDVPQEAAWVEISVDALGPESSKLGVLLNPWGGLPCARVLPGCQPVRPSHVRTPSQCVADVPARNNLFTSSLVEACGTTSAS
jgi:hypothetical protein